jgi:hypothetical protein
VCSCDRGLEELAPYAEVVGSALFEALERWEAAVALEESRNAKIR